MKSNILPRPHGALNPDKEARLQHLIGAADTAVPAAAVPAPAVEQPAPVPAAPEKLPRTVRKRKEPITITVDPSILERFDDRASRMGLSRASALGIAMYEWLEKE